MEPPLNDNIQMWSLHGGEILVRAEVHDEENDERAEVSVDGGRDKNELSWYWTESLFPFVVSFVLLVTASVSLTSRILSILIISVWTFLFLV